MAAVLQQPHQHGRAGVLDQHAGSRPVGALAGGRGEEDRLVDPAAGVHQAHARTTRGCRPPAPLLQIVPGQRARPVAVAEDQVRIAEAEPRPDLGHRAQARPAQLITRDVGTDGAHTGAVDAGDGEREGGLDRPPAQLRAHFPHACAASGAWPRSVLGAVAGAAACLTRGGRPGTSERAPGAHGADPVQGRSGACVAGHHVAPRVDRGGDRLVVLDARRGRPRCVRADVPSHRCRDARASGWSGGSRGSARASHIRPGEPTGPGRPPARAPERPTARSERPSPRLPRGRCAARARSHLGSGSSTARVSSHVLISRWSWLPAVRISSPSPRARPTSSKKGREAPSASCGGPWRSSSRVAEQNQPVDAIELGQQRLPQLGTAQQVDTGQAAEVQVGDDQRAHGGSDGCRPPLIGERRSGLVSASRSVSSATVSVLIVR